MTFYILNIYNLVSNYICIFTDHYNKIQFICNYIFALFLYILVNSTKDLFIYCSFAYFFLIVAKIELGSEFAWYKFLQFSLQKNIFAGINLDFLDKTQNLILVIIRNVVIRENKFLLNLKNHYFRKDEFSYWCLANFQTLNILC